MQANAAGDIGTGKRGGGVLQEKATNTRLLQHANDVRKHANLDTLDAFLQQSGYSWIEMMISHAKDSFESYQTSAHDADSTMAHAFEHHMAAEMLKTPSPKKKRAPAYNRAALDNCGRATAGSSASSDSLAENKENDQLPLSPSNAASTRLPAIVEDTKADSRNTRSRGDKSQLIQLPNPFQARPQQQSKSQPKEKSKKAEKQAKTTQTSYDAAEANNIKVAAVSKSTESASRPEKSMPIVATAAEIASPPRVRTPKTELPIDDDSQEVEYSLQVAVEAQVTQPKATKLATPATVPEAVDATVLLKAAADVPMQEAEDSLVESAGQCTTVEAEDDDDDDDDDDEDDGDDDAGSLTHGVKAAPALHSPSPRESTPPLQSPTKAQRAEMSRSAREKLDKSLLKLASDDEQSEEDDDDDDDDDDDESALRSWARQEKRPSPQRSEQSTPKVEKARDFKSSSDDAIASSDEALVDGEGVAGKAKAQPAPKRTLSSMTHAKKSMAGSSSIISKQQAPPLQRSREPSIVLGNGVAASSNGPQTKSSFLSKSIMRVEQDQRSVENAMDGASLPTDVTAFLEGESSKKRKSDEREEEEELKSERTAKAAKKETIKVDKGQVIASAAVESKMAAKAVQEDGATATAAHPQPQSLREKIESYNTHKIGAQSNAAHRTFSSMSTHSVGLGASKISSPILPRSDSQKSHLSDVSPSLELAKSSKDTQSTSPTPSKNAPKEQGELRAATAKATSIPPARSMQVQSTTPLNSPTKTTSSFLVKAAQAKAAPVVTSSSSSPVRNAKNVARDSIDEAFESDAGAYDTSSDGDLSLVDLMGGATINITAKHTTAAPRPPGTGLRPMSALPKQQAAATAAPATASAVKGSTFMPSSAAQKDGSRPASRLGRAGADQKGSTASTASSSSASSGATVASNSTSTYHATWGGSISSKLKGILGFSSSTSGASPTATASTSPSKSKNTPSNIGNNGKFAATAISIPARKESFVGGSANAGSAASSSRPAATADKKPASVIRADAARKRELEQADRRAKEKEERAKAMQEAGKKRLREEQTATASTLSAPTTTTTTKAKISSVGPSAGKTLAHQASQQKMSAAAAGSDTKKRKSNDGVAVPAVGPAKPSSKLPPAYTTTSKASSSKPTSGAQTSTKEPQAKPAPMTSQANIFSDHNPFQRAQLHQQQQSLAAVSQQVHKHKPSVAPMSKLSPASKAQAVANTAHIELEEPDSAYSDSEDEETIKRRQQHKPWETREGLALALEAQAGIDADMIFGIPQGAVPLDDILPAETEHARVRRMRPRSSSATWSRDGLKQFEIDRYNERMGIATTGVQLLKTTATRDDGSGTPSRSTNGRMSALAQSAIAQGASSSKKSSSQAHR